MNMNKFEEYFELNGKGEFSLHTVVRLQLIVEIIKLFFHYRFFRILIYYYL